MALCLFMPCLEMSVDGGDGNLYDETVINALQPSAPTAAAFGGYGEYHVDLSKGQVPVSIELYNIVCGNLNVPVRLVYHSGGIKVKQEASWVGLGWSLDFGGSVTRTVCGQPDEHERGDAPTRSAVLDSVRLPDGCPETLRLLQGIHRPARILVHA